MSTKDKASSIYQRCEGKRWLAAWPLLALLTALLVIYGQSGYIENPEQCSRRTSPSGHGFHGNSDLYGLGIRIGIYAQWALSLVANARQLENRIGLCLSYLVFDIGLLVALFMLILQRQCTFTLEMLVVGTIFWIGNGVVWWPTLNMLDEQRDKPHRDPVTRNFTPRSALRNLKRENANRALIVACGLVGLIAIPITYWFWIRQAFLGGSDFAPTPGMTDDPWPKGLLIYYSVWLISIAVYAIIGIVLYAFYGTNWVTDHMGCAIFIEKFDERKWVKNMLMFPYFFALYLAATTSMLMDFIIRWSVVRMAALTGNLEGGSEDTTKMFGFHCGIRSRFARWIRTITGLLLAAVTICVVELMLAFNVTDVWEVASTGQVIPLAVAIAGALSLCFENRNIQGPNDVEAQNVFVLNDVARVEDNVTSSTVVKDPSLQEYD